jgi:hypothetical protein
MHRLKASWPRSERKTRNSSALFSFSRVFCRYGSFSSRAVNRQYKMIKVIANRVLMRSNNKLNSASDNGLR